jgi:hypothetical protein
VGSSPSGTMESSRRSQRLERVLSDRQLTLSPPATRLAAPRWLDARLLIGVLLVLVAVVVGAKVVAEADDTQQVWAVTRDLAAGVTLEPGDVTARPVRLPGGAGRYLAATGQVPTGFVLTRPVGAGEVLPAAAVAAPGASPTQRLVTVPVEPFHFPSDLSRGERVDLYVTPKSGPSGAVAAPRLVLERVVVGGLQERPSTLGGAAGVGVALSVPAADAADVVGAARSGAVDLVRVPADQR